MTEEDTFITEEDRVNADLQNITVKQYTFNKWFDAINKTKDGFKLVSHNGCIPVRLTWWKCWFWWIIPDFFLGVDYCIRFRGWKIGHCLNCDANPYDGTVEAWCFDAGWHRGALIRCNKCSQLRWQLGESGWL